MMATNSEAIGKFQDLNALLDAAPDAMLIADQDGVIVQLNERCAAMVGYSRDELVGQPVEVLVPAAQRDLHKHQRAAYGRKPRPMGMGSGLDLVAVRSDGLQIPVEISLAPFRTDRGQLVLAALRDVSRSRHDERLFRQFVDAAPDAVVVTDAEGQILLVNARAEAMFGYTRSELVDRSAAVLAPERLVESFETLGGQYLADPMARPVFGLSGGLFARRKDGVEVPVELSLAPLETDDGTLILAAVRDITERIEILAAVREAEERERVQEEASRAKDAFLATVSHELRTPLTSMLGFAELMTESGQLTPECAYFLSVISRNAQRELRLVEDLLTLVTLADGGMEIRPALVDLATVVHEAVTAAQVSAQQSGLDLRAHTPRHAVLVHCDAERIGQVLDSLLSNALKFTRPGGQVDIRLHTDGTSVHVEVTDSGIGIGEPEPERVFERLYRSRTAVINEVPGAGIGLTIAASIMEAHHGSIRVVDTSELGTTFAIELPLDAN